MKNNDIEQSKKVPTWCCIFCLLAMTPATGIRAMDWPQAMGPDRNGIVTGEQIVAPQKAEKPQVLWQANVGHGWAPVVVGGGKVYAFGVFKPGTTPERIADITSTPTFAEVEAAARDTAKAQYHSRDLPGTPPWADDHNGVYRGDAYALCLDAQTGRQLWATRLTDWGVVLWGNYRVADRSSPLLACGKLFVHLQTGRLSSLDASTGKTDWTVSLFDHGMFRWEEKNGNASSPVHFDDTIIVGFHARAGDDYTKPLYNQDCMAVAGFDAATGRRKWMTKSPHPGFRTMASDVGYATINGEPTVLVPGGSGTMGVDPATGKVRWSYTATFESGKDVRFAYPLRMPVAWQDCVVDGVAMAHDDKPSQTWGVKVADEKAGLLWATHEFVPVAAEFDKANLLARDGRLYGFDAHGVWDDPMYDGKIDRRVMRKDGRFQCRDMATGKLLWSSDAFNTRKPGVEEYYNPQHFIFCGEVMIMTDETGLWFARLTDSGVEVLSRYEQVKWRRLQLSPPVLSHGRLYVRQSDASPADGLSPVFGTSGNLTCLNLKTSR